MRVYRSFIILLGDLENPISLVKNKLCTIRFSAGGRDTREVFGAKVIHTFTINSFN